MRARAVIKSVCSEYRIHNADVYMREDCDIDDLVDVIEGSRVYIPAIYVINKIDQVGSLPHQPRALSWLALLRRRCRFSLSMLTAAAVLVRQRDGPCAVASV
jgi:ribosome-interacting GTPase 1